MIIAKTFAAGAVLAIAAAGFGAFASTEGTYVIVDAGGCDSVALCP